MNGTEWGVVVGAVTAIGWVNWYFFVAGRSATAVASTAGPHLSDDVASTSDAPAAGALGSVASSPLAGGSVAEVVITVDGGYDPNTVRVKAGQRVRLVFDRTDDSSCSEEVVLPDFGVRKFLPSGERTSVEITAPAPGRYPFTCGMSMLRGTIIVDA